MEDEIVAELEAKMDSVEVDFFDFHNAGTEAASAPRKKKMKAAPMGYFVVS